MREFRGKVRKVAESLTYIPSTLSALYPLSERDAVEVKNGSYPLSPWIMARSTGNASIVVTHDGFSILYIPSR
jgi:hypothetical protein